MEPVVSITIPPRDTSQARHLAPRVRDVTWVEAAHGCVSADFLVDDPAVSAVLTHDCPVFITDPTSGDVLWTGAVARGGVQRSPLGDSALVRCVGNTDNLYNTRYWVLPYVVRDYSEWERESIKYRSHPNWDVSTGARPVDPPWDSVVIKINERDSIYPGDGGRMAYLGHMGSDMWIGSVRGIIDHGTNKHPQVDKGEPSLLRTTVEYGDRFYGILGEIVWSTTSVTMRRWPGFGNWPLQPDPHTSPPRDATDTNYLVIGCSFIDTVGYEVTNPNVWMAASKVVVTGQRVDMYGDNVSPSTDEIDGRIHAGSIVEDLIGRCLRGVVDPDRSSVRMDPFELTQADYREPTTPGEVMDDLLLPHPEHLWRLGRRDLTTGLAALEWRLWETQARYLIDDLDADVDLDGASDDLYNSVTVRWADWKSRPRSVTFTADPQDYPDIADLQGIREAPPIDLDSALGEWETVQRIGLQMLDVYARHIPSGTITVTAPVLDLRTQLRVPPSQIEAGATCALTSDEPARVHRILDVTHDGTDVATISFGRERLTLDQVIAARGRRRR